MIKAKAAYKSKIAADCMVQITGNAELVAVEYATLTKALIEADGGQAILDRAMDIMKKEINEHEEKRSN